MVAYPSWVAATIDDGINSHGLVDIGVVDRKGERAAKESMIVTVGDAMDSGGYSQAFNICLYR